MDKSKLDETIKALEHCVKYEDCRGCPSWRIVQGGRMCQVERDALAFLKAMYEQIEDTHSCRLCANYDKCSPDAQFDTPEYQIFAGCHGSLKENWCWKGVDDE